MSILIYWLIGLMPGDPIDLMISSDPRLTAIDAQRLRTLAFAVLVEDASPASVADAMPASYSRRLSNDLSQNGIGFTIYVDGTYLLITPELVAGLLTGLFFLVVVYIGSSCMNDIETPDQFAKVRPMLGKEF